MPDAHRRSISSALFLTFSPGGDGTKTAQAVPTHSKTATSRMGIMGSTETSLPNARLPRMAPTRENPEVMPRIVDLCVYAKEALKC